jgi:hypothetical protein
MMKGQKMKQINGIIAVCMLMVTFCVGIVGIVAYSTPAALIYLVCTSFLLLLFVYAFCAKCPIRSRCVHILMGLITQVLPDRKESPYTRSELGVVILFFAFLVLFPQFWLIQNPVMFLVFWALFIGEWILTHFTCCRGCGNVFCSLRSQ